MRKTIRKDKHTISEPLAGAIFRVVARRGVFLPAVGHALTIVGGGTTGWISAKWDAISASPICLNSSNEGVLMMPTGCFHGLLVGCSYG